jgi:tRNA (guanine-N7-)-methyltransferase
MSRPPISEHRFYGRRAGRALGAARMRALKNLLPKLTLNITCELIGKKEHQDREAQKSPINSNMPHDQFPHNPEKIWLEIGFGAGEHLIEQAKTHPNIGFIGCEPFMNGVSNCLMGIQNNDLDNIRLWADDARLLMDALPDQSLDRIFLLHPDPWPKKRHIGRRFIQTETLNSFARLMISGSELRIATDAPDLCNWMLEKCWQHPDFEWQAKSAKDWRQRPDDWPKTRYGQKQLAGTPVYLIFKRL